ncbi:hypothetical protein [Rhodococcus baikonurensis]|uniref:Uncharacterized protein n=1 Tax=Rhodococcus baikonurensis TaxID=172041 RepID=A0ABV5X8Q4_9NOCA
MSDIIDEIDALVDEQLSGYHDRSGYDYNVNQQTCWHCGREWHGLQITTRMEGMRRVHWYDENYRFAEDDSQILCPGSHFIGPWATKSQIAWIRSNNEKTLKLQTDLTLGKVFPGVTVYEPVSDMPVVESWMRGHALADVSLPSMGAFRQRYWLGVGARIQDGVHTRVIPDGEPYVYGRDYGFAVQATSPELQFPRSWPDRISALQRILESPNPFLTVEFQPTDPMIRSQRRINDTLYSLRGLGLLDEPVTIRRWLPGDPEPDTRTPQERALPRPSTTPPMWAVDAGRQRRTRTNSRRRHR